MQSCMSNAKNIKGCMPKTWSFAEKISIPAGQSLCAPARAGFYGFLTGRTHDANHMRNGCNPQVLHGKIILQTADVPYLYQISGGYWRVPMAEQIMHSSSIGL